METVAVKHDYKNLIFTDHALEQMKRRRINKEMVYEAIKKPDSKEPEDDDKVRYIRVIKDHNVHVVAAYSESRKKYTVVTAWIRGEEDPRPLWLSVLLLPVALLRVVWRIVRVVLGKVLWPALRGLFRLVTRRKQETTSAPKTKPPSA